VKQRLTRVAATALGLALVVGIASAGSAAADDSMAPPAYGNFQPVDPQPEIAGHEGDVLLRVNVAMPAQALRVRGTQASTTASKASKRANRARHR
jgi:uncharacterized lipoprotein YbaY